MILASNKTQRWRLGFGTIVVTILIFICVTNGVTKTDRDRDGLNGSVKKVTTESGTWEKGSPILVLTMIYDLAGNITESEVGGYNVGGQPYKEKLRTIYERNSSGKITSLKSFRDDGSLESTVLYIYDKNGKRIEKDHHNEKGDFLFKVIDGYDSDGNNIETKTYLHDGSLRSKVTYKYNRSGHMQSMSSFTGCNLSQECKLEYKTISTYDAKGNLAETKIYKEDGALDERRAYTYNARGYEQEQIVYNSDGSLRYKETNVYEFDSEGNWIKKTTRKWVTKEGKLYSETPYIVKRTITYYSHE